MWEKFASSSRFPSCGRRSSSRSACWPSIASAIRFRCRSSIRRRCTAFFKPSRAAWAICCEHVAMFSAGQLEPGHDLRPGHHALHLGLDYLSASGQRLDAARRAAEGRRKRAARKSTNTRAMRRCCCACSKAGSTCDSLRQPGHGIVERVPASDGGCQFRAGTSSPCHDDDRRHDVSDVARRADRRVRHRQRHQPVDHGRHSGPHARRRLSDCCSSASAANWAAAAARWASRT